MENHIIWWLCKSMGNSSIFGFFSAVLPQCGICMHLLQVKGWLIIGFPSSRMRVEDESAQVLMRSEHGAAEVYRDELRICMNMGVERESARMHGYVCGARPLKRMRVQHDRAQVCAQSVAVGNRWKVWSTLYALKFRKHNPSHAKMLFHPFLQHFLTPHLVRKKMRKIRVTRVSKIASKVYVWSTTCSMQGCSYGLQHLSVIISAQS